MWFTGLLRTSLGMSAVILTLLVARPWLERRVAPAGRYAAWLLVVLGLLIPYRPTLPRAAVTVSAPQTRAVIVPVRQDSVPGEHIVGETVRRPTDQKVTAWREPRTESVAEGALAPRFRLQMPDPLTLAGIVWLIGFAAAAAVQSVRHMRFFRMIRRWAQPPAARQVATVLREGERLRLRGTVRTVRCACVSSPMVAGLLRPMLLLPELELSDEELSFIVRHELTHYKRRDLWYKALVLCALCVHWFNPLVYRMARAIAADCEMSCDALVLANAELSQRKRYGETILGVVQRQRRRHVALSTYFYEGRKDMKKRFYSMFDRSKKRQGGALVALALSLTLLSGGVLAVAPEAAPAVSGAQGEAADAVDTHAVWTLHERPEWVGDPYTLQTGYVKASLTRPEMTTRVLTPNEVKRLNDLCYFYDKYDLRAQTPIPVGGPSDALSLSTTAETYVASVNRDERGVLQYDDYYRESAVLPFVRMPQRELTDEELLQLIELDDACALLMPYVDEWTLTENAGREVYPNRPLTRKENLRYAEIEARYESDSSFRPANGLTSKPVDGVYILGYNGGGETVYHYPEDRAVSDEEFLAMCDVRGQRIAAYRAAWENEMQLRGAPNPLPEGSITAEQALELIQEDYGFSGMRVSRGPLNDREDCQELDYENATEWLVDLESQRPEGGSWSGYSITLDLYSGKVKKLRWWGNFYVNFNESNPILGCLTSAYWQAVNPDDPHWIEIVKTYLSAPYLKTGEVERIVRNGDYGSGILFFDVVYADGTGASVQIEAASGCLVSYEYLSEEARRAKEAQVPVNG